MMAAGKGLLRISLLRHLTDWGILVSGTVARCVGVVVLDRSSIQRKSIRRVNKKALTPPPKQT
jgi:hypothetical protein